MSPRNCQNHRWAGSPRVELWYFVCEFFEEIVPQFEEDWISAVVSLPNSLTMSVYCFDFELVYATVSYGRDCLTENWSSSSEVSFVLDSNWKSWRMFSCWLLFIDSASWWSWFASGEFGMSLVYPAISISACVSRIQARSGPRACWVFGMRRFGLL